jgi:hypothetical protein
MALYLFEVLHQAEPVAQREIQRIDAFPTWDVGKGL